MAYMDNIAPKRENPISDRIAPAEALASVSNQERTIGQSSKFREVTLSTTLNVGNQVRVQGNDKGTGVVGRPSSIGLVGKDFAGSATTDPSGGYHDPGAKGTAN
jgi:hypothetical protein